MLLVLEVKAHNFGTNTGSIHVLYNNSNISTWVGAKYRQINTYSLQHVCKKIKASIDKLNSLKIDKRYRQYITDEATWFHDTTVTQSTKITLMIMVETQ